MDATHTHYERLAVSRDAPPEVIRAAYKALSQKYHPDKNPGDDEAARLMTLLNQSYDVLMDPVRRAEYDASLDAAGDPDDEPPSVEAEDDGTRLGWIAPVLAGVRMRKRTALLLGFGGVFVISAVVGGILAKAQEREDAMEAQWAAHVREDRTTVASIAPPPLSAFTVGRPVAQQDPIAEPVEERGVARPPEPEADVPLSGAGVTAVPPPLALNDARDAPAEVEHAPAEQANSESPPASAVPEAKAGVSPDKEKPAACAGADAGDVDFPSASYSGYLPGQPAMRASGRSTFTVDNMHVDEDVLVRLVDVDDPTAARSFQVRANSSFTAEQLGEGKYKVLYRPRKSNCDWQALSGVFDLREEAGGVRPTKVKITLHGNGDN